MGMFFWGGVGGIVCCFLLLFALFISLVFKCLHTVLGILTRHSNICICVCVLSALIGRDLHGHKQDVNDQPSAFHYVFD